MATSADNAEVVGPPPLFYTVAFLVVLALRWFWPTPIFGHTVALWPGLALTALGVGLIIWGRKSFQAASTNISPFRPTTSIVTSGPFRFSRNPLYVGLTLIYFGLTVVVNTWWAIVVLVPLLVPCTAGLSCARSATLSKSLAIAIGSIVPRCAGI